MTCEVSSDISELQAFIEEEQDEDRCLLDVDVLGAHEETQADPVGSRIGESSYHRDWSGIIEGRPYCMSYMALGEL